MSKIEFETDQKITHYVCAACNKMHSIKTSPPHKVLVAYTSSDTQLEIEFHSKWKMVCEECFLDKKETSTKTKDRKKK